MKRIEAFVPMTRLRAVVQALVDCGIGPMVLSEALCDAAGGTRTQMYRSAPFQTALVERSRIELVVPDSTVDEVMDVIALLAPIGRNQGAWILVTPVLGSVDIPTGNVDDDTQLGHEAGLQWKLRKRLPRSA